MQAPVVAPFPELETIFSSIRRNFEPQSALTAADRERQRALREHLAQRPQESSMIGGELKRWFQTAKIDPIKRKLRNRFNEIAGTTGDKWRIIEHFRSSLVDRLRRLLPELHVQNLNLLGSTAANVRARQQLSQQISQAIQHSEGAEKERQLQAFELLKALQGLYREDSTTGYSNPLGEEGSEAECYREWLCYMYLASQFFEPGDLTFARKEGQTDQDYQDDAFQFVARAVSDVIRGHNEDHWRREPYHPNNAPSCVPGALGRLFASGEWHKDLTLFMPEPIFNNPIKSIEAAILSQMLQDLSNQDSKRLLKVLDDIAMGKAFLPEGEELTEDNQDDMMKPYPFRHFFSWTPRKKDNLAERLANELIHQWTIDLRERDKIEATRRYKEEIKRLLLEKIDQLLDNKYTTEQLPTLESGYSIDEGIFERFKTGALKKLFEEPDMTEINFLEFYELPGIMGIFYREKGRSSALTLLRNLPAFKENLANPQPTPQYLQLWVDWVIAGQGQGTNELSKTEKNWLHDIFFVDDKNSKNIALVGLREHFLRNLNWDQLSTLFPTIMGAGWKQKIIESSLADHLLKTTLANKQYASFNQILSSLFTTHNFMEMIQSFLFQDADPNLHLLEKASQAIQATLLKEFRESKVNLLNYLLEPNPSNQQLTNEWISGFLTELSLDQLQSLLDMPELNRFPGILARIIEKLFQLPPKTQFNMLLHFTKPGSEVREGSLSYIKYLKENHRQEGIREAAEDCWNNVCINAMQNKFPETCRALWKVGMQQPIKDALREAFEALQSIEDLELKDECRANLSFWLFIIADNGVTEDWVQSLYDQAKTTNDWETCRLFLPVFRRHPEYYHFSTALHLPLSAVSLEEQKNDFQNISQIIYGDPQNKELFISIFNTQAGNAGGANFLKKLQALSHLAISPLSQMQYTGNIRVVTQLFHLVQTELNNLVDPQIARLLARNLPSDKQIKLSEITGNLVEKFTAYFANFPEDPEVALAAYQGIIREAQASIDEKLTEADFDIQSFLLNALLVLLTGGLALIPILINEALEEPPFFSHISTTPKSYLDKTFKNLSTVNLFFTRRNEEASKDKASMEESTQEENILINNGPSPLLINGS